MSKDYEIFLQDQINKLEVRFAQLQGVVKALLDTTRDLNIMVEELDNRIPIADRVPEVKKFVPPNLLGIREFSKKHPFMTENSFRWMLHKKIPGLEECLVRVSSRIYINEEKFFSLIQTGIANEDKLPISKNVTSDSSNSVT
jgi:hypothetical protein